MNKKLIASVFAAFIVLPLFASAIVLIPQPNGIGIIDVINGIFNVLWPVFAAYSVIMFIVSGFQFLSARGEPGGVEKARSSLIWGSAGVAVGLLSFSLPWIIKGLVGA